MKTECESHVNTKTKTESNVNEKNNDLLVNKTLPAAEVLYTLSDFFKIFGDSTRLYILFALDAGPMCVCDLAALFNMSVSAVSHQLKILRQSRLVTYKKQGKHIIYSLADSHVKDILETALVHIEEK